MRRNTISTTINGIPCEVVYDYADPLPATDIDPPEGPEINLVEVRDSKGRVATWLERRLGNNEWQRIKERIVEEES